MDTDKWLVRQFGQEGAENIKGHAATLNMSVELFIALGETSPTALLEALVAAHHKKRNTDNAIGDNHENKH